MNHKDTPQPDEPTGWFQDEAGIWDRPWTEGEEVAFFGYLDALSLLGRPDLIDRYLAQTETVPVETLLNRIAGMLSRLQAKGTPC